MPPFETPRDSVFQWLGFGWKFRGPTVLSFIPNPGHPRSPPGTPPPPNHGPSGPMTTLSRKRLAAPAGQPFVFTNVAEMVETVPDWQLSRKNWENEGLVENPQLLHLRLSREPLLFHLFFPYSMSLSVLKRASVGQWSHLQQPQRGHMLRDARLCYVCISGHCHMAASGPSSF